MTRKQWFGLIIAFFVTRILNLLALPIFNDEAFFIWVGRQIQADPVKNFFINFSDGKEPLFFWIYSLWPTLLGGRLLSVLFGFVGLVFIIKIARKLKIEPIFVGLAYIVNPFILFYNRLGVQETILTGLLIVGAYFLLFKKPIFTGVFLGLASLTKTTALAIIIFFLPWLLTKKMRPALLTMAAVYLPVLWGLGSVFGHNAGYVGLIGVPQIVANAKQVLVWSSGYFGWPLTIFGLPALLPAFLESLVAKIFFPRYFLFCAPAVILFSSWLLRQRLWLFLLLLIPNLFLSWQIIFNPNEAALPAVERWQYLESWPSGAGIKETAAFLANHQAKVVVVEDIMLVKYGLSYYYPQASYQVGGLGDYYVFDREQNPQLPNLKQQLAIDKIGGKEKISVWSTQ